MSDKEPSVPDINRRLESIIRVGTIAAVDHGNATVQVKSGGLLTDWLPWLERRAGETSDWDPPTPGEQCVILSPSGEPENGFVLCGLFSNAGPAPNDSKDECTRKYPDGARITYNHKDSHLTVTGIKTCKIECSERGEVDCPEVVFTGKVTIQGLLTYQDGIHGHGGDHGHNNMITGDFIHDQGILSSHGIVLHTHDHTEGVGHPT